MRIVHIITRLIIGGAQENTVLNCEDLIQDYGDDVLLLTGPSEGPEGSLIRRIQRENGKKFLDRPLLPGEIPGAVPHLVIPSMIRSIRPDKDWAAYRQIREVLRQFRPDVVHTHSAKAGILGRYAASAEKVPAIVHTVHGAPFYPWQNPLIHAFYRWCERRAAGKGDAFISVADAMTDLMVAGKVASRAKFTTIYSGMEVEPFLDSGSFRAQKRKEFGFTDEMVVIGKIARLFYLKGHEYVIAAAGEVIRQCPQARFLFVGDGILTDHYRKMIAQAGLSDYFYFSGLVQPEDIPAVFSAMDIVVHTSLREGLARVLPQGLLAGKPVVSYDVDGAREVVIDEQTGFLLPPKEVNRLSEVLIRLVRDSELRSRLGAEGRARFRMQFDHRYMTGRIRDLYQKILDKKAENIK